MHKPLKTLVSNWSNRSNTILLRRCMDMVWSININIYLYMNLDSYRGIGNTRYVMLVLLGGG